MILPTQLYTQEALVPLLPSHEGNFEGHQVGPKVTINNTISAIAMPSSGKAGRSNGIIDAFPLYPLDPEDEDSETEWVKNDGRMELFPSHSTIYHPPYDFSHENEVTKIKYCRTGNEQFASTSLDGNFQIYNTESMRETFTCQLHSPAYSLAFSPGPLGPNSELFAAATRSGPIPLIDPRIELPVMQLTGNTASVLNVAWHPIKSHVLISGGVDAKVRIWDIRAGRGRILGQLKDPKYDETTPVTDLGATVGLAVTEKYIISHHHRNLPRALKSDTPTNLFYLKIWELKTLKLISNSLIPSCNEESDDKSNLESKAKIKSEHPPSNVDHSNPIFYTRQRRTRPKSVSEKEPKVKSKPTKPYTPPSWKNISNSALLNHHNLTYHRTPLKNLDPELGLIEDSNLSLDIPYMLIPPHPLNLAGACIAYNFKESRPCDFIPLPTSFHKPGTMSLRPTNKEIYMGVHSGGIIMRFSCDNTPLVPIVNANSDIKKSPNSEIPNNINQTPDQHINSDSDQDNWSD